MASHKDKRKSKRFSAPVEAFVFLRPTFANLGRVVNLSEDGLGMEYVSDHGVSADWAEVDIVLPKSGEHISRVQCRIVHDSPIDEQPLTLGLVTRRCGLQWGSLTPGQHEHIKACTKFLGKFNG